MPTGVEEAAKLDQQQKFGQSTVNNGKFANNFGVPSISSSNALLDANQASTSKAAAQAQATEEEVAAMAVAKYTGGENVAAPNNGHQLLRMASVSVPKRNTAPRMDSNNQEAISYCCSDDVHGHLDNMQDELESLKDLLRGDGVAIDQNMLLGVSILRSLECFKELPLRLAVRSLSDQRLISITFYFHE